MVQGYTTSQTTIRLTALYDLQRFLDAQNPVIESVYNELKTGQKATHWMWFIFPQLAGLGRSWTAEKYALSSLAEAQAYCGHELLYDRLIKCCELLFAHHERSARDIFGSPDDLKLRSSMTLFSLAQPEDRVFRRILDMFYAGEVDSHTVGLIHRDEKSHNLGNMQVSEPL